MKKAPKNTDNNLDRLIAVGLGVVITFSFYSPARLLINDVSNNLYEHQISDKSIEKVATSHRNIFYCNTNNPAQMLDLFLPKDSNADTPLVVFVHGGGWEHGDKVSKTMSYYGESLVGSGIAVASLNYRMHPTSHYPDAHDDIRCATEFLQYNAAKYGISAQKWGIMGDSAGAELAAYELQAHSEAPYKAFVGLYGPYDLALQITRTPRHDVNVVNFLDTNDTSFARSVSPISLPVKTSASYLLIHGLDDKIVPFVQSQSYQQYLKDSGADSTLISIPDSGHYISPTSKPGREEIRRTITDFFARKLR